MKLSVSVLCPEEEQGPAAPGSGLPGSGPGRHSEPPAQAAVLHRGRGLWQPGAVCGPV